MFAAGKLSGGESIKEESIALSAFMCRFGGLTPVNEDAASTFVTNHMATYCDIELNYADGDKRNVKCEISYPSEPTLVEASAYLTSRLKSIDDVDDVREKYLGIVKKSIFSQSYVTALKGDVGELMASVLLCYTLDVIRENKIVGRNYEAGDMSSSVDIIEFLDSLYPNILLQEDIKKVLDSITEYVTDVTHFVRLPYVSKVSTCAINHIRGAAIITPKYHPSVDFYMSFSSPSSRCPIHCRVQVKNKSDIIGNTTAVELLKRMTNRCIPTADEVEDSDINQISVSILINVGSGSLEPCAFIYDSYQTRNSTNKSTCICIALNIREDEKKCFKDLSNSILQLVGDIAACDNNHKTEPMIKMSLGKTYYNDLKACI